MTEAETKHATIALYRYMCQNIIGTEEHVKTLRMLNNVRDNLTSNAMSVIITSGSFGEGLVMRGSDLDIMCVNKNFVVCEDTKIPFKPFTTYFEIKTEDTPPGFTQLRLLYSIFPKILEGCVEIEGEYYCSNTRIKENIYKEFFEIHHGPCISDKHGLIDLALCFQSKSWITQANQWITRSNNSWPGYKTKDTIIKHGVLFVPIGVKGSTKEKLEWRISFSVGEKMLIYTFTHTQLICYALMKILLKDVIAINTDCKDLLCSYFLKTILFWISEELPPSQWIEQHLICCFMRCFRRLIYCVKYSVCPHYFIPENNLFENKIKGQPRQKLLDKLYNLDSYGWKCILFSDQISNIHDLPYCMHIEPSHSNVENIKRFLFSIFHGVDSYLRPSVILENKIHSILSSENAKKKYLYTYYLSKMICANVDLLPFLDISGNKPTYKQYTTCISTVLRSINHDAVSGWLMLASFFYNMKQYKKALYILKYSLLKCTAEKLYPFCKLSNIHYELLNLNIFRKMHIVQVFKYFRLDHVYFRESSTFLPEEIQMKGLDQIPPVVFAHFLSVLCYYHFNDTKLCQNSLRNLQLTIEENYFMARVGEKVVSYDILGLTFQLIGDLDSARQAFMQSIELFPEPLKNSAYHRLQLIS